MRRLDNRQAILIVQAACLAALSAMPIGSARAETKDEAPVVPYRPTVSNPAQLPAPGQLELELGGARSRVGETSDRSVPYLLKLAFTPAWGLLIGGDAYVRSRDAGLRISGVGDTSVAVKHAWQVDEATAFGAEFGVKLPTARKGLGSGHADYTLNTIFSRDLGRVHMDVNLNVTRLGAYEPGSSSTQVGASAAFSTSIVEPWGVAAELSGDRRKGADRGYQGLAALTYSPSPRLTLDLGAALGHRSSSSFSPSSSTTKWFAGAVFPLAQLW